MSDIPALADPELGATDWGVDVTPKTERIFDARMKRRHAAWLAARSRLSSVLHVYLNGAQHDAAMLAARRQGECFTLTASDENVIALAASTAGASWYEHRFPFDLVFEGTTYVGWRYVNRDGRLGWAPPPDFSRQRALTWLNDSLIESESPGIRWALSFDAARHPAHRLLLVEASTVRVVEHQRTAWQKLIGEDSLPLFDAYFQRRQDYPLTRPEILSRFLREHGISRFPRQEEG